MKRSLFFPLVLVIGLVFFHGSYAAGFKVYGYGTRKRGEVEFVYFNNYFARSALTQTFFGKAVDREGHFSHSLEVEYGFTDRWTVAAYVDFEQPKGEGFRYTRVRGVFFRYRFFEKGDRFINTAIYLEYYLPRKSYKNEEELEIKVILEKDVGPFRIDLNPSFEKAMSGPEVGEGLKFNYASGIYWSPVQWLRGGMEFYGKLGELSELKGSSMKEGQHWVFPSLKFRFPMHVGLDVGVGFGLTDASDDLIVKSILSVVI